MIPLHNYTENNDIESDFSIKHEPSLTYRIMPEDNRIVGKCDKLEAIKQAVYKIIFTERYEYVIYSWKYGIELADLIGKPLTYVMSVIPARFKDALLQDDRIEDVKDFEMSRAANEVTGRKNALHVKFTVVSTEGTFETSRTVNF